MIQKTYWGQGCGGKEESLHKSQCNSTELCVNAILQADYLPQYCRSNSSPSRLNSLLIKLPQTVSYDGLDPHLPLRSTPHPTAINFSIYLSLGWVLLHSHVDTGRRNKFAIGHAHGHHHNTATFSCSIGARLKHGLPYPVGLKREAFQKNINTRTHTKLLLMEELKEVTERRSCRSKNWRTLATQPRTNQNKTDFWQQRSYLSILQGTDEIVSQLRGTVHRSMRTQRLSKRWGVGRKISTATPVLGWTQEAEAV